MTIKELNKLIKEELDAFMQNEDEMDDAMDVGDDIEVTTDEPEEEDDALSTLKQIYDMLKPLVEPEEEIEDEGDMEDIEGDDNEGEDLDDEADEADEDMKEEKDDEKDEDMKEETNSLNESFDGAARFKKLANIIK
jgi:hypothetical protein